LTDQRFLLIAIKTIVQGLAEGGPVITNGGVLNGLIPDCCGTLNIHGGDTDPKGGIDRIHVEVALTAGTPEARIFTIEFVEGKFGQTSSEAWVVKIIGVRRRCDRKARRNVKWWWTLPLVGRGIRMNMWRCKMEWGWWVMRLDGRRWIWWRRWRVRGSISILSMGRRVIGRRRREMWTVR
jgi:hypothetical protein